MKKRLYLFSFLIFVFLIGFVFLFATGNIDSYKNSEKNHGEDLEKIQCVNEIDCADNNSCTIDYCSDSGFCENTKVILCYQNDGCCPKGCTSENDNDC